MNKSMCNFLIFTLLVFFCRYGLSGSLHYSGVAPASIFATGLLLLKSWQPEKVDHALISLPVHGDKPPEGKPESSSASSGGESKEHRGKTPGATGSGSHSGASGGDDGKDDPPQKKPIPDGPTELYLGQPEEFEGVTFELISTEPLVFRISMPKQLVTSQEKLNSNTPWIQLRSGSGSAYLSLYTGRPDHEYNYYRVFPIVRLDSKPVSGATLTVPIFLAGMSLSAPVVLPGPNDPFNSPTESISFTHDLDALPDNPSGFRVTLTHVSQASEIHSQPLCFHFHSQSCNPAFLAYTPPIQSTLFALHRANEHKEKLGDCSAVPECKTCQHLTPVKGYRQWRTQWNRAAAAEEVLVFDIAVELEGEVGDKSPEKGAR